MEGYLEGLGEETATWAVAERVAWEARVVVAQAAGPAAMGPAAMGPAAGGTAAAVAAARAATARRT